MKRKLILFITLLLFSQFAYSQQVDSVITSRHSIGVTVNPIYGEAGFRTKNPTAYGLLYRYEYKRNRAIRAGAVGAYERRSFLTTHEDHPAPQDSVFTTQLYSFSVGHEWTRQLNGLFFIGYGLDVSLLANKRELEVDNILIGENVLLRQQYKQQYTTTGVDLQPFLNLNLRLSPRLYLTAECKAVLSYNKEKYEAAGTYGDVNERLEDRGRLFGGTEREAVIMSLHPLSSLQLNFRL